MSQLLPALLASKFQVSMQEVVISLHFVFAWDCTRSDDNQTQMYGWGSVLLWFTLFTSLIEEESGLLVMLQIIYTFWMCLLFGVHECISRITKSYNEIDIATKPNLEHRKAHNLMQCTQTRSVMFFAEKTSQCRFPSGVFTRGDKDLTFSKHLLLPKMPPFYICDHFHMRGKFQMHANDLLFFFFLAKWKRHLTQTKVCFNKKQTKANTARFCLLLYTRSHGSLPTPVSTT